MKLSALNNCELEVIHKPLFDLGQVYSTTTALKSLQEDFTIIGAVLSDHIQGNWGNLSKDDQVANFKAVLQSERILSKYIVNDVGIYVITEHDRKKTTILLSSEY